MTITVGDWAAIGSVLVAVVAGVGSLRAYFSAQTRHSDAYAWALQCIEAMQIAQIELERAQADAKTPNRAIEMADRISVLIEQGRLLFRNKPSRQGREKEAAYRGIRPVVLDMLIVGHDAVRAWERAEPDRRTQIIAALNRARGRYVSLMQLEVGRSRTVSKEPAQKGQGQPFERLLDEVRKS